MLKNVQHLLIFFVADAENSVGTPSENYVALAETCIEIFSLCEVLSQISATCVWVELPKALKLGRLILRDYNLFSLRPDLDVNIFLGVEQGQRRLYFKQLLHNERFIE